MTVDVVIFLISIIIGIAVAISQPLDIPPR